jgi:hypothetical protein
VTTADKHAERGWTLPAAAGLAAVEATVVIAVILYRGHTTFGAYILLLALKYPICWLLVRRQAWAAMFLLLWEPTIAAAALFAPRIPLALRLVEVSFAGAVVGLLLASLHLFPSPELPRR